MNLDKQRQEIKELEEKLAQKRRALETAELNCGHDWGEPKYDMVRTPAYTIPGDPPGVGGIDRRSNMYVPESHTERWTRTCKKCGKVESTTQVNQQIVKTPKF